MWYIIRLTSWLTNSFHFQIDGNVRVHNEINLLMVYSFKLKIINDVMGISKGFLFIQDVKGLSTQVLITQHCLDFINTCCVHVLFMFTPVLSTLTTACYGQATWCVKMLAIVLVMMKQCL